MEDQSIEINLVTFNTLISRSTTFKTATNYYQDLKQRNIKPTINTFITLLKKATTKTEIIETEKQVKNENIRTNNNWDRLLKEKKYRC
jgi:predicted Zn-dependent peptidase